MSGRRRLDELVVARGLARSRSEAKALIMAGKVRRGAQRLDKPGMSVSEDVPLTLEQPPRFVSRGGEKLDGYLQRFSVSCAGSHALDVGASTGGFTDCLLQRGAASVTCLDVGRGQLRPSLLADPRVVSLERVNARLLQPGDLPREAYDLTVMDLAFISLRAVLPAVWPFVAEGGLLIALVKPQFEVGRERVGRGGVVRDPAARADAIAQAEDAAVGVGFAALGARDCRLPGPKGNREAFLHLRRG